MATLTKEDWGKIHAKAWVEPEFRQLLERDTALAVQAYEKSIGKEPGYFDQVVKIGKLPYQRDGKSPDVFASADQFPPWCC